MWKKFNQIIKGENNEFEKLFGYEFIDLAVTDAFRLLDLFGVWLQTELLWKIYIYL